MRAAPTPADVARYRTPVTDDADLDDDELAMAAGRLPVVAAMAAEYTRGQGFSADLTQCTPGLWAVIVAATARECESLPGTRREEIGDGYSVLLDGSSGSWSLRELAVLHAYRRLSA